MSERKRKSTVPLVRDYWQGVSATAAVRWHEETFPNGGQVATGPTAVVVYGDVTWRALQDLELSKLTTMRPGHPEWEGPHPPDERTLSREWNLPVNVRRREAMRRMVEDEEYRKDYRPTFEARTPEESVSEFYKRVSDYYRMRMALTGRPTHDLATAAGVPPSTAARWVREARVRGFLPPTSKGRSSS